VVHRFRLIDSAAAAALGAEAIRAAAEGEDGGRGEGQTVSNRAGSWHSRADMLLPEGGWPEVMVTALSATVRDAVRLAWGAEEVKRAAARARTRAARAARESTGGGAIGNNDDGGGGGGGGGEDDGENERAAAAAAAAFAAAAAVQAWMNVSPPGGFHRRHEHGRAVQVEPRLTTC